MNRNNAKKVLKMLDRINQEIDFLGNLILQNNAKPVAVRVKVKETRRIL